MQTTLLQASRLAGVVVAMVVVVVVVCKVAKSLRWMQLSLLQQWWCRCADSGARGELLRAPSEH